MFLAFCIFIFVPSIAFSQARIITDEGEVITFGGQSSTSSNQVQKTSESGRKTDGEGKVSVLSIDGLPFSYSFSITEDGEQGSTIRLGGVHIRMVSNQKDTVNLFSTVMGIAELYRPMKGDSVEITYSCLGYKTLKHKEKISNTSRMIDVKMAVDPLEISSIIVSGEQIAMVVRGDTTIYNAGAFKTMRGDMLSELLKKLPGVEVVDNRIYAEGAPVKRILVNGTTLFGDMVDRASELLSADEIKDVKIYDQHSERDVAIGDTLKPKDKVIDVTTKRKITKVSSISLHASAGVYLDKNASGKYEPLYSIQSNIDRHKVDNNLTASVNYGNKVQLGGAPSKNYTDDISGSVNWNTKSKDKKLFFNTSARLGSTRSDNYSSNIYDYFPSEDYTERSQSSASDIYSRTYSVSNNNNISYRFDKDNDLSLSVDASYKRDLKDSRSEDKMSVNGSETYSSNMSRHDKDDDFLFKTGLAYSHNFAKPNRRINTYFDFNYLNGCGSQWSVDTLQSSSQKVYLTNDRYTMGYNNKGGIGYQEPLSEKWSMSAGYTIDQRRDNSQRISIDRLTGLPDMNNSHNYSNNLLDNTVRASFRLTDKWGYLSMGLAARSVLQKRDETVPDATFYSKHYLHVAPALEFSYRKNSYWVLLQYSEQFNSPSIEQLRSSLDIYNAPFYTAGNPALKATTMRSMSFKYGVRYPKAAGTLTFSTSASHFRNQIVYKDIFFTSAGTYEGFGDFIFPAGSTLKICENVSGQISANAKVGYSGRLKHLQSTFGASIQYNYDRTPYYLYENLFINNGHRTHFNIGLTTNFSRFIELNFSSRTGLGYFDKDANSTMKEISEIAGCKMRLNFAKRMWLILNGEYRFRNTTVENTRIDEVVLDAELSVTFGKENRGRIGLHGNDLLNQVRSLSVTMMDDYTRTRIDRILGRNVYLSFNYRF